MTTWQMKTCNIEQLIPKCAYTCVLAIAAAQSCLYCAPYVHTTGLIIAVPLS